MELIYVMVIVGILAAVAAPMVDVNRFRMNAAVTNVAMELMAAQRSAVLRGHDIVVAMDPSANRLRVHNDANNDGIIQASESWKVVELPEGVTFGLAAAPELDDASAPFSFSRRQGTYPALTFHRNGSTSEMGVLYLTAVGGGSSEKNDRAVEVIRSTAKVKCWSYSTRSWLETC